ncbi:unnamed protein product [Rotaria magnacalcarata]|uniref:N-terminal asparagine amidohydrolase n=2 Tax=Rotaria magnacalcarata TaxID=392030 RepID=A0A816VAX8_9BILA|nr:unnamed protein product [Rotaria magnacalcarata]
MVLLIDNHVYSKQCSLDDLAQHRDLINSSRDFASSQEFKQSKEEISKTIYVYQREFAVIANNDPHGFHLVGSDNATTCHILVLDNHRAVALAHLDGAETQQSIEEMIKELKNYAPHNTEYDVYLAGGFLDDSGKQHSRTLSNEILNLFSKIPNISFHLKLAAITMYNDHIIKNIHYPQVYGICFDVQTKNIRKMNFIDNGPAFRLRTVYQSANCEKAWCIYSSLKRTIEIKRFFIKESAVERFYKPLYRYYFHDDQQLLAVTSTSPAQELESYIINMKKTTLYILKYYKVLPEWFDKETHSIVYYRFNDTWKTDNKNIVDDVEIE